MAQKRREKQTTTDRTGTLQSDIPETTADRSKDGRRFAERYREETTDLDPEEVTAGSIKHSVTDVGYTSRQGHSRTVRAINPMPPASYNDTPEGFLSFWDGGQNYGYNPETRILKSLNQDGANVTLAKGDDISLREVNYPTRAVVVGAVQDDVTVRVFYRSNQSGRIKTMDVEIGEEHGKFNASEITGTAIDRDYRVELRTRWERDLKTVGISKRTLGKVVRVEFPRGHQYTVDLHGLVDRNSGEDAEEKIREGIGKRFYTKDLSINVQHEGRIPDE